MAPVDELIKEEYPRLAYAYQHDIRFSDILYDIRLEIAKPLATAGEQIWKRVAYDIGMSNNDIEYCSTLKNHNGCSVMNMFDIYSKQGKDSLHFLIHALAKRDLKRILTVITYCWDDILKAVRVQEKEPDVHDMQDMSTLGHTQHHMHQNSEIPFSDGRQASDQHLVNFISHHMSHTQPVGYLDPVKQEHSNTNIKQYAFPLGTMNPAMAEITQFTPGKYDRTRAWVEKHTKLKVETNAITPGHDSLKTERRALSSSSKPSSDSKCTHNKLKNGKKGVSNGHSFSGESSMTSSGNQSMETDSSGASLPKQCNGFVQQSPSGKMNRMVSNPVFNPHVPEAVSLPNGVLPSFNSSFLRPPLMTTPPYHIPFNPLAPIPNGNCFDTESMQMEIDTNAETRMSYSSSTKESKTSKEMLRLHGPLSSTDHSLTMPLSKSEGRKFLNIEEKSAMLYKSPSCEGKFQTAPFSDSSRPSRIFITHLYQFQSAMTPQEKQFNKCAVMLGRCLKDNNFRVKMDVPHHKHVPDNQQWREWLDTQFSTSHYILVCITPTYLELVHSQDFPDEDVLTNNMESTRYIYHLMEHEIEEKHENLRFIPILFENQRLPRHFLPHFLQKEDMGPYVWSCEYMNLLWRLDRPESYLQNHLANPRRD